MANRPYMIISNKKQEGCIWWKWQKKLAQMSRKRKHKRHYNTRDYLGQEMYDYIRDNWSHWKRNKSVKEELWKPYQENIQQIRYKWQLPLEPHILQGKYCSLKLEVWAVGPEENYHKEKACGKRRRNNSNNNNNNNNKSPDFHIKHWRSSFILLRKYILHIINKNQRPSWKMTTTNSVGIQPYY